MKTSNIGVIRDGDFVIAQAIQQTGHIPGYQPARMDPSGLLLFLVLYLLVWGKRT